MLKEVEEPFEKDQILKPAFSVTSSSRLSTLAWSPLKICRKDA
jgi:hypothetical protein